MRKRALDDGAETDETGIGRHAGPSLPADQSDGLLDLAGLEAARADVDAAGRAVDDRAHLLEVRLEPALGGAHRMAPALPEGGALAAAVTDLGHAAAKCSGQVARVRASQCRP